MQLEALLDRAQLLANTSLMRGGFVPSDEETRRLADDSTALSSQLLTVKEEIARLTARQDRITRQLDLISSTLAPIRRVPREILSEVFVSFMEQSCIDNTTQTIFRTVASVCRLWRDVALDTPRLWTHIHASSARPDVTTILAQCLEQVFWTGNSPLALTVNDRSVDTGLLVQLLTRLGLHTVRLQSINLLGLCPSAQNQLEMDFSALRAFKMQTSASLRSGNLACLAGANGLEQLELSFRGKDYDSPLREIQVPTFPRLKHLSVDAPRVSAPPLFALLWSCRATLDSLWLCFRKLTSVDDAAAPSMPALRSLRLEEHAHCVLPLIDTPALEDIYIGNVLRRNPFASLVASEATARIQHLTLVNFSVYGPDEPSVWAFLEHMQCLQTLELDTLWQVSFSEQLIARLTCAEDRTPLLRRMTTLCLNTELYVELTLEIRAMVASRRNARLCSLLDVAMLQGCTVCILPGL